MSVVAGDAIVLHVFDYLETSRVLRLATRERGLVSVIARGARRSERRFGAALDLFSMGIAEIDIRTGRDLHQLRSFEVTSANHGIAGDLDRFGSAAMLAELVFRCSPGEEQSDVYAAIDTGLRGLLERSSTGALMFGVSSAWQLAAALGFGPVLEECAGCYTPVAPAGAAHFACAAGGVLCERCARAAGNRRIIPPEARSAIRHWLAGADAEVTDARSRRAHARLLREFVFHHIAEGQQLRAFDAWSNRFAGNTSAGTVP
ncbi:MAG: DNA repair protein RecO [Gemmatimonadota bacterium]